MGLLQQAPHRSPRPAGALSCGHHDVGPTDPYEDSEVRVSRLVWVRPDVGCLAAPSQANKPSGAARRSSLPVPQARERHLPTANGDHQEHYQDRSDGDDERRECDAH